MACLFVPRPGGIGEDARQLLENGLVPPTRCYFEARCASHDQRLLLGYHVNSLSLKSHEKKNWKMATSSHKALNRTRQWMADPHFNNVLLYLPRSTALARLPGTMPTGHILYPLKIVLTCLKLTGRWFFGYRGACGLCRCCWEECSESGLSWTCTKLFAQIAKLQVFRRCRVFGEVDSRWVDTSAAARFDRVPELIEKHLISHCNVLSASRMPVRHPSTEKEAGPKAIQKVLTGLARKHDELFVLGASLRTRHRQTLQCYARGLFQRRMQWSHLDEKM